MKLDDESIAFAIVKSVYESKFKEDIKNNLLTIHDVKLKEKIDKKSLIREGLGTIFYRLVPDVEVIDFSFGGESINELSPDVRRFLVYLMQMRDIYDDYYNLSEDFASVGEDLKIAIDKIDKHEKMQSKYLKHKEIKGKHRNDTTIKQLAASSKGKIDKNALINVKRNK